MQNTRLSPHKSKLGDRRLFIFGTKNLQNELLCYVLNKELGIPSSIIDQLSALNTAAEEGKEDKPKQTQLLLIDTVGLVPRRILEELKNRQFCTNNIIAFFNLKRGLGIEQEAICQGLRGFFYEKESLANAD